jgi:acyl carrier protein
MPGLGEVRIEPKRGRLQHELTQFRYDATLRFVARDPGPPVKDWHDWRQQPCGAADIRRRLHDEQPACLALCHVTNARVAAAVTASAALRDNSELSAGELLERLLDPSHEAAGIDPEDLWSLADEFPYQVDIDWSQGRVDGSFDAVLRRAGPEPLLPPRWRTAESAGDTAIEHYANRPLASRVSAQLAGQLREHLKRRLPDYMVPDAFVVLDKLPLSPQGKVDRARLPAAGAVAPPPPRGQRSPTSTEAAVARIWAEVLRVAHVGLDDNFFDLGGHSLMALQVIVRVREQFAVELPVRSLFEAPTVAGLSLLLTQHKAGQADQDELLRQLEELEQLSDEQVRQRIETGGAPRDD